MTPWIHFIEQGLAKLVVPLAFAVLFSGLDDLFLCLYCAWVRWTRWAPEVREAPGAARRIAIFVPCWREAEVIGTMVEHNLAAIDYENFDLFVGAYPNDEPTVAAVRALEGRFGRVRLAVCPHQGPTSKADCLNWVFQRMLLDEERDGIRYDIVMTHDAEDLIHPGALEAVNRYVGAGYDMVQVPVLPLPTPWWKLTHGVYCDEFAEFQAKDMPARCWMGSFLPSNGVGTGFAREALERLAEVSENQIFEPGSLTEDYEIGLRLHRLGARQIFVPLRRGPKDFLATREFFPSTVRTAVRQRTRWVTGIALQTWERHGWQGPAGQVYWFWRDRKGLLGNPLGVAVNLLALGGALTFVESRWAGGEWVMARLTAWRWLLAVNLALQAVQSGVRMAAVWWVYGGWFALGVPLRTVWANGINGTASLSAVWRYATAKLQGRALVWVKTSHAYPSRGALLSHKRRLGEILVARGLLTPGRVEEEVARCPVGTRLGEHLVRQGEISEEDLYQALSVQQSLPAGDLEAREIEARVVRTLPKEVMREWRVLPFRVVEGSLFLASPEIPTDEMSVALRGFTRMSLRYRLVTPGNFEELTKHLL